MAENFKEIILELEISPGEWSIALFLIIERGWTALFV